MSIIFAGDIGGTKTILRIVDVQHHLNQATFELETLYEVTYASEKFADFTTLAQTFLNEAQQELKPFPKISCGCLGIAGPVVKNTVTTTNLPWVIHGDELAASLGLPFVKLINDFVAVAYGILGLADRDLHTLQTGILDRTAPIAILGAGTGLGECFMIPTGSTYYVGASEGGHVEFAPRTALELQLADYLCQTEQIDRVSLERVVSGTGIVNIYRFLSAHPFAEHPQAGVFLNMTDPAAAISQAALSGDDEIATETMNLFIQTYGSAAGDLALHLLPYGGLYLAGGVAAKNLELFAKNDQFMQRFRQKGRLSSAIISVPVQVILNPNVGAIGAAVCAAVSLH